jgi:phage shock protein A
MENSVLAKLKMKISELEEEIDELDTEELVERVNNLEEEINYSIETCRESEINSFNKLLKRINIIKKNNDFYDEDAELDRMFPDRQDEDFDEDSTSYDSVFGKD